MTTMDGSVPARATVPSLSDAPRVFRGLLLGNDASEELWERRSSLKRRSCADDMDSLAVVYKSQLCGP